MPGCEDDRCAAVAEYVVVAFELRYRMLPPETGSAKRVRPLVFSLLHQQHDLREQLHIADVVWMTMRDGDTLYFGGLHAQRIELRGKRLR